MDEFGEALPIGQHNTETASTADVNILSSPGEISVENVSVEDIGTQLIKIESIQQTIRTQAWKLEDKPIEKIVELESLLPRLDGLKSTPQRTLATHTGPWIPKLHIFRLPDELLIKISENLRGDIISEEDDNSSTDDIRGIKNLRLTCKRLCNASSHLLLRRLDIALTYPSLQHLEMVSRHPTISKGIRSLQICVGVYDPRLASNLQSYISRLLSILMDDYHDNLKYLQRYARKLRASYSFEDQRFSFATLTAHEKLCKVVDNIGKCRNIVQSCDNFLQTQIYQSDKDQTMATLHQAYKVYVQRLNDQDELLQNDKFVQVITEAVARMPTVTGLTITDRVRFTLHLPPTEMSGPFYNSVREQLLQPVPWTPELLSVLSQRPVNLLYKLPLAFIRAGKPLTELRICLEPTATHELILSEELCKDLANAVENLEVVEVNCDLQVNCDLEADSDMETPAVETGGQGHVPTLVPFFLKGTKLRSVTLRWKQRFEDDEDRWDRDSLQLLTASLPWGNLKRISLINGDFEYDDLSKHLEKLKPGTYILLKRVKLVSGLWADLLDLIRAKGDCHSDVIKPDTDEPELFTTGFRETYKLESRNGMLNPGTAYIRGQTADNPLRTVPSQGNMDSYDMDDEDQVSDDIFLDDFL